MKTWPIIFVCLNTGAVHIELAKGYSTKAFLTKLEKFMSLRGCPTFMYSDLGSNLVRPGKVTQGDDEAMPWQEIKKVTGRLGIEWHHAPSKAQFRDGATESVVKMLKHTLKHLLKGGPLDYDEFDCVLAKAANILNERPLTVRVHSGADPEFCPITPNLLMMSQRTTAGNLASKYQLKPNSHYTERVKLMEKCYQQWWEMWFSQVFPQLVPVAKWRSEVRNMRPGDVVLVQFTSKVPPPKFRMGIVKSVKTDNKGLVRSCMVAIRPKDAREKTLPYKSKDMLLQEIVVQRLVVYLPLEDQEVIDPEAQGVLETTAPHICPDAVNRTHEAGIPLQQPHAAPAVPESIPDDVGDEFAPDDDIAQRDVSDDGVHDAEDALEEPEPLAGSDVNAGDVHQVAVLNLPPAHHHESPEPLPWVPSFEESSLSFLRDAPVPSTPMYPKILLQIWS